MLTEPYGDPATHPGPFRRELRPCCFTREATNTFKLIEHERPETSFRDASLDAFTGPLGIVTPPHCFRTLHVEVVRRRAPHTQACREPGSDVARSRSRPRASPDAIGRTSRRIHHHARVVPHQSNRDVVGRTGGLDGHTWSAAAATRASHETVTRPEATTFDATMFPYGLPLGTRRTEHALFRCACPLSGDVHARSDHSAGTTGVALFSSSQPTDLVSVDGQ